MSNTRRFISGLLVVSVIGLLIGYAWAAQQSTPGTQGNTSAQGSQATSPSGSSTMGQTATPSRTGLTGQNAVLERTSKLIGKDLKNAQGEKLGSIHDIVLTPDFQRVAYVALSSDDKYYALPWSSIHMASDGTATASLSKQAIQQMSSFDKNTWPSQAGSAGVGAGMGSPSASGQTGSSASGSSSASTAGQSAGASSGQTSGTSSTPAGSPTYGRTGTSASDRPVGSASSDADIQNRRVSKLTGISVRNNQGQDIGDVEDFVVDASNGQVAYAIVSFGGFWGIGEKNAAVPSDAIQFQSARGFATLNADRQTLESVAFDPDNFPDLSNPQYTQQLRQVFKAQPPAPGGALGYVAPGEQPASSQNAWGRGSEYNRHFDANQITTIKGTVQSIGTFSPARGVAEGLRLRVKTTEGKTITVYAGPVAYAQQQNFALIPGDQITITGSDTRIGWRSVIMASEIQKDGNTLRLRNRMGEPLWTGAAQGAGQPSTGVSSTRPSQSATGTTPEPNQSSSSSRSRTRQQSQM